MVLTEVFLGAFLSVLFDKLASPEFLHFVCGDGVRSKLKKLKQNLEMIQAVLSDAEEKQLTQNSIKIWLADLRDLAYDVEDLLGEFATEDLRRNILVEKNAASSSRMKKLIPARFTRLTPSFVKFDADMKSKIKAINSRLDELCQQRVSLGLQTIPGAISTATATRQQRLTTTSVPTEPVVYGRENDKAKILKKVLRDGPTDDDNFSVIPIVGMGGLGKTTLARLVYNDETVKGFLKAWVCVSDEFDVLRISKAILESITLSSCSLTDLNPVQVMLKEEVAGKKFLLVLDDVWSKDYGSWETLKSPFVAGAPGSKIIVTTRLGDVASTMGTTDYYNLELLSDDHCWSLFRKHAIQSRDIGTSRDLELFREKVVEKCKGLPLAAKTLGGLLRSKQRNDEWEQILNSKIWYLSDECSILPVLRLSYYHLPSHLKRCFAYSAILPKDYEFKEEEVVLLWIAEGLVQPSEVNEQLEDLGCGYFRDLLSRSMFQQSSSNRSKFVMHDLINDLALWVSGHTCFRLEDVFGTDKQSKRLDMARHSSYNCGYYDSKEKFEVLHKFEHLRTFLPVILHDRDHHYVGRHITNVVLSDLLPKLKRLRVLSLRKYHVIELPNSVGGLNHLTYLNLSGTMITCLPESTYSLLNLHFLILIECPRLMKLPSNIRNLINLRYLVISGKNLISEMPLGMKDLKCLQRLSNFIVGKGTGSGLEDLRSLKFLRGELYISRLENVTDSQDITEALLGNTKNLEVLLLEWGSQFDHPRNEATEENLLEMLQPQRNLKELTIKCFSGRIFPSWIGDPTFSKMGVLKLENCRNCIVLPSLGQLSSLKVLTIIGMTGIKRIGSEMHGENSSVLSFQSLKSLSFEDLPEWEHWDPADENEHVERFPHLRKLSIVKCPKLSERLPGHLSSLRELMILDCSELVVSLSSVSLLCELTINGCKRMECSSPTELQFLKSMTLTNISDYGNWLRHGFPKVERLRVVGFEGIRQLWQSEICIGKTPQGLHTFTSLRELCIKDCPSLVSFEICIGKTPQGLHTFTSLRHLCIIDCPSLVSFPDARLFSGLREVDVIDCPALNSFPEGMQSESLKITGCHSLTFFTKGQIPPSLKKLHIINCKKLRCVLDDREYSPSPSPSPSPSSSSSVLQFPWSLQHLVIGDCPKLESIAERFHNNSSLEDINLSNCEDLKFIPEGLHNLCCLGSIYIRCCPSLVSFPDGGLPITNLKHFSIDGCKRLKALPNGMHSLKSLKRLTIIGVGTSLLSLPEDGSPTYQTDLATAYQNIYKPLFEWGLHKLTSLADLEISGNPHAESFPDEEIGMSLPRSLTRLGIRDFPKLKYLSSKGFQNLTSLKYMDIFNCPNLTSFPEVGLPSSLLRLEIYRCPLLGKKCKRDTGKEWSKIAHIPAVFVNHRSVYCSEEDNIPFPRRSYMWPS